MPTPANGIALTVKVLTGAAAVQNGATNSGDALTTPQLAITPTATGSWVYGALDQPGRTARHSRPGQHDVQRERQRHHQQRLLRHLPQHGDDNLRHARHPRRVRADIRTSRWPRSVASGTLAEDATSPASVHAFTAETVTTASFTPPAGSLLVAMLAADYDRTPPLMVSVGGGSLTWTQLAMDAHNLASVWIATAPGTYTLFSGFADSWTETAVDYEAGYSEITLGATDGFGVLTANTLPSLVAPVGAADDSGTRVNRILDWAGWPPSARQIDTGDTLQQATSLGSDALSLLQLTADTEIGEAYVNGAGNIVFRHRQVPPSCPTPGPSRRRPCSVTFPALLAAAGTELPYASVSRANDNTTLANDIQITIAGSSQPAGSHRLHRRVHRPGRTVVRAHRPDAAR